MRARAAVILFKDNKMLLLQHTKDESYYVAPGGHVENGETYEQAAIREIKEECNFHIKIIRKIAKGYFKKYNQEEIFFLGEISGGELTNEFDPDNVYGKLITDFLWIDPFKIDLNKTRPKKFFEWYIHNINEMEEKDLGEY